VLANARVSKIRSHPCFSFAAHSLVPQVRASPKPVSFRSGLHSVSETLGAEQVVVAGASHSRSASTVRKREKRATGTLLDGPKAGSARIAGAARTTVLPDSEIGELWAVLQVLANARVSKIRSHPCFSFAAHSLVPH
jgi:hypothetical protein